MKLLCPSYLLIIGGGTVSRGNLIFTQSVKLAESHKTTFHLVKETALLILIIDFYKIIAGLKPVYISARCACDDRQHLPSVSMADSAVPCPTVSGKTGSGLGSGECGS